MIPVGSHLTFLSHAWLASHANYAYSTLITMSCSFRSCQQVPSSMSQRGRMTRCSVSRWQILIWTTRSWRRRRLPSLSNLLTETTRSRPCKKVGKSSKNTTFSQCIYFLFTACWYSYMWPSGNLSGNFFFNFDSNTKAETQTRGYCCRTLFTISQFDMLKLVKGSSTCYRLTFILCI